MDTVFLWLDLLMDMAGALGLLASLLVQQAEAGHNLPTVAAHPAKSGGIGSELMDPMILLFYHMRFFLNFFLGL